jgi:hypothetical protein
MRTLIVPDGNNIHRKLNRKLGAINEDNRDFYDLGNSVAVCLVNELSNCFRH